MGLHGASVPPQEQIRQRQISQMGHRADRRDSVIDLTHTAVDTHQQPSGSYEHGEEVWHQKGQRPNKGQNKGQFKRKRPPPIVGTRAQGISGGIMSGPADSDIKVWNINPTHDADDIRGLIEGEGVNVKQIEELSKPGWRTKSFRITIPHKDRGKILNPDVWYEGVRCGNFWPGKKRQEPTVNENGQTD